MQTSGFTIRNAELKDLDQILNVFSSAILYSAGSHYDQEQINVWLGSAKNEPRWIEALNQQYFRLICLEDRVVGIGSLRDKVYIDFFFVHPEFQGKGLGRTLMDDLLEEASKQNTVLLSSHVSLNAVGFFMALGFRKIKSMRNEREGVILYNYLMQREF